VLADGAQRDCAEIASVGSPNSPVGVEDGLVQAIVESRDSAVFREASHVQTTSDVSARNIVRGAAKQSCVLCNGERADSR